MTSVLTTLRMLSSDPPPQSRTTCTQKEFVSMRTFRFTLPPLGLSRAGMHNVLVVSLLVLGALSTLAWVYPEHRSILLLAIQKLDPERRAVLDRVWAKARVGHESRLTEVPADFKQGEKPEKIDFGAWPAISGDHSVSPQDMLNAVLESDWILDVADIAARMKTRIAEATIPAQRDNAMRDADIQLQRADPDYATRSSGNAVHYPLGRQSPKMAPEKYFDLCFAKGAEMNAVGAYGWYHYSALLKAGRYARESLSDKERSALALAILADEAYAHHFLEDLFAAGHSATTRGNSAVRKGTHDYYNEFGFETSLWNGEPVVILGDVYMRPEDAALASRAVKKSLEQVLDACVGTGIGAGLTTKESVPSAPDTMKSGKLYTLPDRRYDPSFYECLKEIIPLTPMPGLSEGYGELPRFRAELGPFIGIAPAAQLTGIGGGFAPGQEAAGAVSTLEFSARFGVGLEGVMNKSSDGLAFLDLGLRLDGPSTNSITESEAVQKYGDLTAAIPSRNAFATRLRLPFWLIPGDLLIAAPILIFVDPVLLTRMGVDATNGGYIPWQSRLFTSIGTFQFVLGREIGASFYGYFGTDDRILVPDPNTGAPLVVDTRSIQFDFPIVEYRPFRSFASDQTSSLVFQLYWGFDIPTRVSPIDPANTVAPDLETVWFGGIRLAFDWRHYF
jgi:hypothetical protein